MLWLVYLLVSCISNIITLLFLFVFFFFSSRRRHTRSLCDWSSDVCSSDLRVLMRAVHVDDRVPNQSAGMTKNRSAGDWRPLRSEERRVGKECRSWWSAYN